MGVSNRSLPGRQGTSSYPMLTVIRHKLALLLHVKTTSLIVVEVPAIPGLLLKQHGICYMLLMACDKAIDECPETALGEVSILEQYLSSKFFNASILSS